MEATTGAIKGVRCGVPEKQERLETESYTWPSSIIAFIHPQVHLHVNTWETFK